MIFDLANPKLFATAQRVVSRSVCYINGHWVESKGENIAVNDPCTGDVIGEVPKFGEAEAASAIAAAEEAFKTWRTVLPRDRALVLRRWADLMLQHQHALGALLARESGKVVAEGVGEVVYAERFIEWFAGEAERIYGDLVPSTRHDVQAEVIKQPIGVVGIITPWNFPAAMITRGAAAAIAAGCTVVVKPASATPFSALALAQLADEAGLPAGVFNVVTGPSGAISKTLLDSFVVRKIAFTGSTEVGKSLYAGAAATMKKVGMELGGNAPLIVFDDADLTRAVEGVLASRFRNAGQTCICCNRVLVQKGIYPQFVTRLVEAVRKLRVGNNFDPDVKVGALINAESVTRMAELVQDAVATGARLETGGKAIEGRGYFFEPTVLSNVDHAHARCCREEIFGPIIPVVWFATEQEAVAMANDTKSGLASYFFTTDYRKQHSVSRALQYGMVGVNEVALSNPYCPFGGVKESGLGRDGSKYGIEPYVDIKYVLRSVV